MFYLIYKEQRLGDKRTGPVKAKHMASSLNHANNDLYNQSKMPNRQSEIPQTTLKSLDKSKKKIFSIIE